MFAKVYTQIFASSIAENYTTRHVFMDLLVLADSEGVVDMTLNAISRTTNVPILIVEEAIKELSEPDPSSRSPEEDGRRIALIDSHRDWGWRIINYDHYRQIRDEEGRRAYHRDYMKQYRSKGAVKPRKGALSSVKSCKGALSPVKSCDALLTHAEEEVEGDAEGASSSSSKTKNSHSLEIKDLEGGLKELGLLDLWREFRAVRKKHKRGGVTEFSDVLILRKLMLHPRHIRKGLEKAISSNWQGFEWDWVDKSLPKKQQAAKTATAKIRQTDIPESGPLPAFKEFMDQAKRERERTEHELEEIPQ